MSFILDALKKSEIERQRQTIPGLVDSGTARPRARLPGWAIALCVLLAVNLIVLLVVLVRGWVTSTPAQPTAQARPGYSGAGHAAADEPGAGQLAAGGPAAGATSGAAPAATSSDHFSPLDAAPMYAPEIPVPAAPAPQAALSTGAGSTGARAVHHRDPVLTDEDYKANDEEVLPTINEISLTGAQALPELHLDVHVFATKAADRFVYINMRKYHEGATLQEGPTIERIRRDGVILSYQGLRFVLPRQ
ncbi:MAG: general secretion pathway protein GspB [Steroidobacteraceae bacterium]